MRWWAGWGVMWLAVLAGVRGLSAQADEINYWMRLEVTHSLIQQAIGQPTRQQAYFEQIRLLWPPGEQIQVADGRSMSIDMRWLTENLNADRLPEMLDRVGALLVYYEWQSENAGDRQDALAALERVLADERFQYATRGPPDEVPESRRDVGLPGGLSEILLIAGGLMVAVLVLVNLARALQTQRAGITLAVEPDADPTTSAAARDLAAASEQARDYRSAIRYLYLFSLLFLDERGLIHYDPALTNREHLRQVAGQAQLGEALREIVNTFDRVWYGFAPADEALYARFRRDVERLREL